MKLSLAGTMPKTLVDVGVNYPPFLSRNIVQNAHEVSSLSFAMGLGLQSMPPTMTFIAHRINFIVYRLYFIVQPMVSMLWNMNIMT